VRQIFPLAGPEFEVVPGVAAGPLPPAVEQLAALYGNGHWRATAGRPWLRANMIASTDGAAELGGRSGGLGGPGDRMVFAVLRSLADVILVGAGTARAEHYRPADTAGVWSGLRAGRMPAPAIAVVSNSLDLDGARLLTGAPAHARPIVITTAAAPASRAAALADRARLIVAGQRQVDVGAAVAALAGLGHRHILAEGGPHLLGELAEAGLLDELCLTTSPVLAAGSAGRIVASRRRAPGSEPATRLRLAHVLADADFLFSRYIRSAG
jgi:riboflavin biosynthesis pyrimidine reductase